MSETQNNTENEKGNHPPEGLSVRKLRARYNDLLEYARWALWWEETWPVLWNWFMIAALFVSVSWLGLWGGLSGSGRLIGVLFFISLLLYFGVWPFIRMHLPDYGVARQRVAKDSALSHNPVFTVDDHLAIGVDDLATQRLWRLHQTKALEQVAHMHVEAPSPNMPQKDPFALRFICLLMMCASFIYAGPDWFNRLQMAFDWQYNELPTGLASTSGWIAPPAYTGQAAVLLDFSTPGRKFKVPVGSSVVVRAGSDDVRVDASGDLKPVDKKDKATEQTEGETEKNVYQFELKGAGSVTASTSWFRYRTFQFEAISDTSPQVHLEGEIKQDYKGAFTLSYRTKDDYGIAALKLDMKLDPSLQSKRSLVPAPEVRLTLPPPGRDEHVTETEIDVSEHPWAGAPILMTIIAVDDYGNEGRSETFRFLLPERRFGDPLAAALAEQRRKTALYPDDFSKVQVALDALMIAPEEFTENAGIYVALHDVASKLRRAKTDEHLIAFIEDLWALVQVLDGGRVSDARAALNAIQEQLEDAIARGASEEEIKQLTKEYQNAMNRYIRELAEESRKQKKRDKAEGMQGENISREQLNDLLKKIEEAMERGDTLEAQRLMEELARIMENLEVEAAEGTGGDPFSNEMEQTNRDMNNLLQDQQQLQDETYKERRNSQSPSQDEEDDDNKKGEDKSNSLAERQQRLRGRLEQLQKQMKALGMEKEERFSDAEEAMREVERALEKNDLREALGAQKDVLKNLERAARNFARQQRDMQEAEGIRSRDKQEGRENPTADAENPYSTNKTKGGRGEEKQNDVSPSTRARKIIEELQRKLGQPERPQEELNYFERLLKLK